eukprot:7399182-Alexandrium_andersonii.AAC.1
MSAAAASRRTAGSAGKVALGAGGGAGALAAPEPELMAPAVGAARGWLPGRLLPVAGRRKPDCICKKLSSRPTRSDSSSSPLR